MPSDVTPRMGSGLSDKQKAILVWLLREYQRIERDGSDHDRFFLQRSGVEWAPGPRHRYWWGKKRPRGPWPAERAWTPSDRAAVSRSLVRLEQRGLVRRIDEVVRCFDEGLGMIRRHKDGTPWPRRWNRTTHVMLTDVGRAEVERLTHLLSEVC
jgi:hypothetical protein